MLIAIFILLLVAFFPLLSLFLGVGITAGNTCRQVTKGGKFVAWLDAGALDRPHRCERFRVKAVRH